MKYVLLTGYNTNDLAGQVMALLLDGWQLQGGVSVAPIDDAHFRRGTLLYAQALTLPPGIMSIFVGLDLGQKRDHSAIAVVERVRQHMAWCPSGPTVLHIRYLQRIPLGTSYLKVVERVGQIVGNPLLAGRCRVVADATGVGGPVVDLLRGARLRCGLTPVTITSGDRPHSIGDHWHVPKTDLMTGLLVALEAGELVIPRGMADAGTLLRELRDVEVQHRAGGSSRMGADGAGQHDDLVIAVALACWRARQKENSFGTQRLI